MKIPQGFFDGRWGRHRIRRLSVFGSALRSDFSPESDIDFLVEFLPEARPTLFDLGGMLMDLRELVGREVDLLTPAELSPISAIRYCPARDRFMPREPSGHPLGDRIRAVHMLAAAN